MAAGSGHFSGSKCQSPCSVQWKKSMTITDSGRPRRLYSRATAKQLLLRAVAQLALPEARRPFRQHGRVAGGVDVVLHDLAQASPRRDPVVDLLRGLGHPQRAVVAQLARPTAGLCHRKP